MKGDPVRMAPHPGATIWLPATFLNHHDSPGTPLCKQYFIQIFTQQFCNTNAKEAIMEDGHCTLLIALKQKPPPLTNNWNMARHCLNLLRKILKKTHSLMREYTNGIHESLSRGHAEGTNMQRNEYVGYQPQYPRFDPQKRGNVRIVFNYCARYQGTSLNDCINQDAISTSTSTDGWLTRWQSNSKQTSPCSPCHGGSLWSFHCKKRQQRT